MTPEEYKHFSIEESALKYALIKMKLKKHSMFRGLFFIFLLCSIQIINLALALMVVFVFFLYKAYVFKVFKYVYHYEIEDDKLKLYLLNILGEKRAVIFMKSNIDKLIFSDEEQTICILDKIGKQVFDIVSLYSLDEFQFKT